MPHLELELFVLKPSTFSLELDLELDHVVFGSSSRLIIGTPICLYLVDTHVNILFVYLHPMNSMFANV